MQSLREIHKDARRSEILRAARDLVADGGVEALTMRSVADMANVSVPTIYNLIGQRAEVLAALMEAGGEQFGAIVDGTTSTNPVTSLIEASEALASVLAPNAAVVAAVLQDGIGGPMSVHSLFGRFRQVVAEVLVGASKAGWLERPADPDLLADRCTALAAGAVIAWATVHHDEVRLRDELVHGAMLVIGAHVVDDQRARVRRELDRRARRLAAPREPSRTARRRRSAAVR